MPDNLQRAVRADGCRSSRAKKASAGPDPALNQSRLMPRSRPASFAQPPCRRTFSTRPSGLTLANIPGIALLMYLIMRGLPLVIMAAAMPALAPRPPPRRRHRPRSYATGRSRSGRARARPAGRSGCRHIQELWGRGSTAAAHADLRHRVGRPCVGMTHFPFHRMVACNIVAVLVPVAIGPADYDVANETWLAHHRSGPLIASKRPSAAGSRHKNHCLLYACSGKSLFDRRDDCAANAVPGSSASADLDLAFWRCQECFHRRQCSPQGGRGSAP